MEFRSINDTCYYFSGPVNIGYVQHENEGLLVDAGIDASTMKKVIRQLREAALPLTHLFITHAHADHYGGARYLQEQLPVYTIVPVLEEVILRNPVLEPLYLFGGNNPLPELRNKFLEGSPIRVDEVVAEGEMTIGNFSFHTYAFPGHSYYPLGLLIDDILYAGDAYFSEEQLKKHKIPFLTNASQTIDSLEKLKWIHCDGALPGHGTFEKGFYATIDKNVAYHNNLLDRLIEIIDGHPEGLSHETIIALMCEEFELKTDQLSQWLLYRTAITGYLTALIQQGKIINGVESGRWVFRMEHPLK